MQAVDIFAAYYIITSIVVANAYHWLYSDIKARLTVENCPKNGLKNRHRVTETHIVDQTAAQVKWQYQPNKQKLDIIKKFKNINSINKCIE